MLKHFDRVQKRLDRMNAAKLKMGAFRQSLDEINHYSKIEKDAGQAFKSALGTKKSILSQYKTIERQYQNGQIDKRHFNERRAEWRRELKAVNHEIRKMKQLDKQVHPELKEAMKNFKDSFKAFKKLLRT